MLILKCEIWILLKYKTGTDIKYHTGSNPVLTTKNKMDYAGAYPEKAGRTMYTTNRNPIT